MRLMGMTVDVLRLPLAANRCRVAAFAIVLLAGPVVCRGEDRPLAILAVGDSITQGSGGFSCYREYLVPMLADEGERVVFIGPNRDRVSSHCGFGGKNTAYLSSIIRDVASKYPADVVLLHSGHNSFSKDKPVAGIVHQTEQIIETLHELNPKVVVLLAQVIPSGKLPKYDYIPELNLQLAESARRMQKRGLNVEIVNQAEGFDWMTDTVADKVHPNPSGAKKMADRWMQALQPVLDGQK